MQFLLLRANCSADCLLPPETEARAPVSSAFGVASSELVVAGICSPVRAYVLHPGICACVCVCVEQRSVCLGPLHSPPITISPSGVAFLPDASGESGVCRAMGSDTACSTT